MMEDEDAQGTRCVGVSEMLTNHVLTVDALTADFEKKLQRRPFTQVVVVVSLNAPQPLLLLLGLMADYLAMMGTLNLVIVILMMSRKWLNLPGNSHQSFMPG
jgi:uncharacterized membrane protein YphA (DoxX/SURF4 family)